MLTEAQEKYLTTLPKDKIVHILPYSSQLQELATELIAKVQAHHPEIEARFLGAAALGIAGQNDLDLDFMSSPDRFSTYLKTFIEIFGEPRIKQEKVAAWSLEVEGIEVDMWISDPASPSTAEQWKLFCLLKKNPALTSEYEQLKLSFDGKSYKEYQRAKYEFYNRVLASATAQNQRSHASQLPSSSELKEIITKEATRPLAPGKEKLHFVEFHTIEALLQYYHIPDDYFRKTISETEVLEGTLTAESDALMQELVTHILADTKPPLPLFNAFYDYLAGEDIPQKSDLMFVFGSQTPYRVEHAAKLYHAGYAPKILISGKGPNYGDSVDTEAERLAQLAIQLGVPEHALILEKESITMTDNVRRSLNLLDKSNISYSSLLVVNSPYSQRRGWALFKKYLPDSVPFFTANAEVRPEYRREEWYRCELGLRVILNEAIKLKISVALNTA